LADVLVGLLLLAVAAGGVFAGFKGVLRAWTVSRQVAGEQQNARAVLDWMARRIRMAGVGYSGSRLMLAAPDQVAVAGDFDGDGAAECHRFYLDRGVVFTTVTEAATVGTDPPPCTGGGAPLSADLEASRLEVRALQFRYFDDSAGPGAPLAPPLNDVQRARIRRIRVEVQVSGGQLTGPFTLATDITLR
jgi:hypothetical protein